MDSPTTKTEAEAQYDAVEGDIGAALELMAKTYHPNATVEYSDGYYIVFADGSSLSVALTALPAA